jgi:hypothetical protein
MVTHDRAAATPQYQVLDGQVSDLDSITRRELTNGGAAVHV